MVLQFLPSLYSRISVPDGYGNVVVYVGKEIQRGGYFSSGIFEEAQPPIFKRNGPLAPP